jgi:hypothetical protein
MDGTAIQTVTTFDAVKSADQVAAEQRQQQDSSSSSSSGRGLGGLIGGLAARRARANNAQPASSSHVTVMTITGEILRVATSVSDVDLALPAGFRETK